MRGKLMLDKKQTPEQLSTRFFEFEGVRIFGNKRQSGTKIDQESASRRTFLGVWPD